MHNALKKWDDSSISSLLLLLQPLPADVQRAFLGRWHLLPIKQRGRDPGEARKWPATTQPRVSDLTRGKVYLFSPDALIGMAAVAGLVPKIKVKTKAVQSRQHRSNQQRAFRSAKTAINY